MTSVIDINGVMLTLKVLVALGMAVAGIVLLLQEFRMRQRPVRVVVLRPLPTAEPRRVALGPVVAQLAPGDQLSRLAAVMSAANGHVDAIHSTQTSASIHIDAAEHALNRLIGEVAHLMPMNVRPSIHIRRELVPEPGATRRHEPVTLAVAAA